MKQYERYKDSGVEWLGEVPEHWEILKGKRLFIKQNRHARVCDEIVTCFRDGQVTLRSNRRTDGFTNAIKEIGYQGVRNGDFVIHNMDAFAGAIGVSDSNGKSTPVYSVCTPLKPNRLNVYYYSYLLRNLALNGLILSLAKGIRERSTDFRFSDFGELEYYVPHIEEQGRIVAFLDEKCEKIDRAVEQKERMIELLQERRSATIQRAVTQGLDPNVPLKDSNIDWIGQIPTHWQIKKLKYVCDINKNVLQENTSKTFYFEYVDIGSVTYEDGIIKTEPFIFDKAPSRARRIAQNGDIIISTVRTYLKAITIIDDKESNYIYSTGFAVLNPINTVDNHYLYCAIKSDNFTTQVSLNSKGMSYPAITAQELGNQTVFCPPLSEQREIADHIDQVSTKTEQAIKLKRQEIERLKEYRQTLINSAVTGKIKID